MVGLTTAAFFLEPLAPRQLIEDFVLRRDGPIEAWWGKLLLHVSLSHLAINMAVLLVAGQIVCSRIGNRRYLLLYGASAAGSAVTWILVDGGPVVGASGAISGIVGAWLALVMWSDGEWFVGLFSLAVGVAMEWWLHMHADMRIAVWSHAGGLATGAVLTSLGLLAARSRRSPDSGGTTRR